MITILIGNNDSKLSYDAHLLSSQSIMINQNNYQNLTNGIYYTSLAYLPSLQSFIHTLEQADVLIYNNPTEWSDNESGPFCMKNITEFYLRYFINKKQVIGIDTSGPDLKNTMLQLEDQRKTDNPQLWIAGCSISLGIDRGILKHQRYGELLANYLAMPVSFLTKGGSSIRWQADQILRSDIKEGDTLVWGITSWNRITFMCNNFQQLTHLNVGYYQENPEFDKVVSLHRLCEENNLIYHALTDIHKVINICKKLNVRLVLAGLLVDQEFLKYLVELPNYIHLIGYRGFEHKNLFPDIGTDNKHPGPLSHIWFTKEIIKALSK
jgi:hypothetical protein